MSIFTYQNAFHSFKSHILSKTVHSSAHWNRFQPSISNSLRVPASILKNAQKGHFHTTGVFTLHVARVLLQTTHYALGHSLLYQTVFTACRCDLLLPSNRPGTRALQARFSQFSFFPCLMLNEWRTFARATGAPSLASGPKFNTTC